MVLRAGQNQRKSLTEVFVQLLRFCSLLPAMLAASAALAADADNGKRLAEMRCVNCTSSRRASAES